MRARGIAFLGSAFVLAGVVAACHSSSSPGSAEMQSEAPSPETWATIHRGITGWVVHPVDLHTAEAHVEDVDTSAVPEAGPPDAQLLVHGVVRGSVFSVDEACRALPGGSWSPDDVFIRLENHIPVRLNLRTAVEVPALDLSEVDTGLIDHKWLENRIHEQGAVLAGRFIGQPGRRIERFEASAVFVPLPDRTTSCEHRVLRCPAGTVATYARDLDRCLVPRRCIAPTACPSQLPTCAAGYVLRSWRAPPHACPDYACDASFLPE